MYTPLVFILVIVGTVFAQFNQYCTVGCTRPITYWKNDNVTWPTGYPKTTTICGTTVEVILDAYTFTDCGQTTPISVLGQFVWAQLNAANGACRTVTAQSYAI